MLCKGPMVFFNGVGVVKIADYHVSFALLFERLGLRHILSEPHECCNLTSFFTLLLSSQNSFTFSLTFEGNVP